MAKRRPWTRRRVQRLLVTLSERSTLSPEDLLAIRRTAETLGVERQFRWGRPLASIEEFALSRRSAEVSLRKAVHGEYWE